MFVNFITVKLKSILVLVVVQASLISSSHLMLYGVAQRFKGAGHFWPLVQEASRGTADHFVNAGSNTFFLLRIYTRTLRQKFDSGKNLSKI